jgi:hypothetical protein
MTNRSGGTRRGTGRRQTVGRADKSPASQVAGPGRPVSPIKQRLPVPRIEQRVRTTTRQLPASAAHAPRRGRRPIPAVRGARSALPTRNGETMRLCGWCARAMFDRDHIIDEQDLAAAVGKRFEGTPRTQELATRGGARAAPRS